MPRRAILDVYCAYCGKYLYSRPGYGVSGISHGICAECEKIEEEKLIDQIAQKRGISKDEARKLVEIYKLQKG